MKIEALTSVQIVETEAYPAGCPRVPKASHGPGTTFVYSIYGVSIDGQYIQGFFSLVPPKKLKYGKPRLGESTLT